MKTIQAKQRKSVFDWDFRGEETRTLTHCFHDYPARMIPQIPSKLLELFGTSTKRLFDPYCGTGTSLVQAQIFGIDAVGTDINPLARLITKVKTTPIRKQVLDLYLKDFIEFTFKIRFKNESQVVAFPDFSNMEFWFQQEVIRKLAILKKYIWNIEDEDIRDFFKVAFSETVRESSLTRNSEFKLYRMAEKQIKSFDPDVFAIMEGKLSRNRKGMIDYLSVLNEHKRKANVEVLDFNTVNGIPDELLENKFDMVITSPPYGDSHTTVAYGQYSRLSNQWMDFKDAKHIDKKLMGGYINGTITKFGCKPLDNAITRISEVDEKRAREITAFYVDLEKSIDNVSKVVNHKGYVCYVVGNRRVKGVTLPTDESIVSFFGRNGFVHIDTFVRNIPNKRMPTKNSPTNVVGKLDTTMLNEYIVVMRKS